MTLLYTAYERGISGDLNRTNKVLQVRSTQVRHKLIKGPSSSSSLHRNSGSTIV